MKSIITFVLFLLWIAGVVVAKGVWSTFFAFIFPFWAYYLIVEQLLFRFNII